MWTCPVCEQQCDNNFCAECGFDYSTHYEQFPTLQTIPPTQSVSGLRTAYQAKNTDCTCPCCGGTTSDGRCLYCGFEISEQIPKEELQRQAMQHALSIIEELTSFSIAAYRYEWVPERSRLEKTSPKIVRLGNARDFFNNTFWATDKFAQLRDGNGTELNLSITYKYKGKRKILKCAIPTVKCDDFWRICISLDMHMKRV